MNTQQADELLSAYLDGELSAEEQSQVERWLAEDPARQKKLAQLKVLRSALRSLPRDELPAEFPSQVLKIIERSSLLSESAAATGDAGPSKIGSKLAASRRWLRYGVRVLAPLATAALGLMFIFASNFFVEQAPTAPQSDAGPPRRSFEPPPAARESIASGGLAEHDASPPGEVGDLSFPNQPNAREHAEERLPPRAVAGPLRSAAPAPSRSMEPGAPPPADPGGGGQPEAQLTAAAREAGEESDAARETLREALAGQQEDPDTVAVVKLYLERKTEAGNKALTPQEGEKLVIDELRARRFEAVTTTAQEDFTERLNAPVDAPAPVVPGLEDPLLLIVGDLDAVETWWDKIRFQDEAENQIRVVAQVELQNFAQEVDGLTAEITEATNQFLGRQAAGGVPGPAAQAKSEEGLELAAKESVAEDAADAAPAGILAQLNSRATGLPSTGDLSRKRRGAPPAEEGSERALTRAKSADKKKQKGGQLDDIVPAPPAADNVARGRDAPARSAGSARAGRQTARVVIRFLARPPGPADEAAAEPASSTVTEPANSEPPEKASVPSDKAEGRPQ